MSNRESKRVPRDPRTHLRSPLRARVGRRTRIDGAPVAICRLKRVASDLRGDIRERRFGIPHPQERAGAVVCIGAGPARSRWPTDLIAARLRGGHPRAARPRPGGLMRTISRRSGCRPRSWTRRLQPSSTWASTCASDTPVSSLRSLLAQDFDAVFIGNRRAARQGPRHPGRHESDGGSISASTGSSRSPSGTPSPSGQRVPDHRRPEHRDGLLPLVRFARGYRHQGDGAGVLASSSKRRRGSSEDAEEEGSRSSSPRSDPLRHRGTARWSHGSSSGLEWDEQARHSTVGRHRRDPVR